ncbi:MAG: hypothetical protein GX776_01670, partial [Oxalobacter sp.]|nr:hypothetical protein [Oxalobacter sp.]
VGTIVTYGGTVVPAGFLSINSDSPICVGVATYPQLAESVWCGEELNESADFFYRCDGMDGADRNPDGAYLVLPAASKYFLRGRDASGEVHPYRYQEDATKVLLDGFSTGSNRAGNDRDVAIRAYTGTATYGIVTGTTTLSDRVGLNNAMHSVYGAADETRPMNFPVMVLIKAFDATLNPGMVDVTALANDVNQKVGLTDFGGSNQRLKENGYQIMPGGMLMQWGIIPANTSSVIFKKPFSQIFGVTFGWCNANAVGNAYSQWLGHQSISSEKMIVLSSGSVRFFTAIGMS